MAVYSKSGEILQTVYGADGYALAAAYNKAGEQIHPDGPVSLRVCSYNVGGWYIGSGTNVPANLDASFYALQDGMISAIDADILCIQEYWSVFSKTGRTAESLLSQYYPYRQSADGSAQYTGRAICSKYPIISYTQHTFTGESRYYDCAVINIGGTLCHVFVTHLHPSDQSAKIAEATELFNYIQAQGIERFIVCGDFNSTLYDPMSQTNIGIYKQFLDIGCTIANDGAFGILPTACNSASWANDKFAIDNIICSSGITITEVATNLSKTTNADVLAANKIDHVPLFADVEI